jgi:hypothetical protein
MKKHGGGADANGGRRHAVSTLCDQDQANDGFRDFGRPIRARLE